MNFFPDIFFFEFVAYCASSSIKRKHFIFYQVERTKTINLYKKLQSQDRLISYFLTFPRKNVFILKRETKRNGVLIVHIVKWWWW